MSQAKIVFERPSEVEFVPSMPKTLPKALRKGAASRRDALPFVPEAQHVVVSAVKIPFFSMVWQLIKLAVAAIPAILVLSVGLWGCIVLFQMLEPEVARLMSSIWLDPAAPKAP
jgi:hypothetical protein